MSFIRNSLLGKICIGLLATSTLSNVGGQIIVPKLAPITGKPIGMGFRVEQKTVQQFMRAMQEFLPHFLTFDIDLETH